MSIENPEDLTFYYPRVLSFFSFEYLYEGAKVTDDYFASKILSISRIEDGNKIGNINATRQSLMRAVFISSYAIFEQVLDELMWRSQERQNLAISPNDLKHRGINRSIIYANKILGKNIDTNKPHWKDLLMLQKVRNHLVHYGPEFSDSNEHRELFKHFKNSKYVTLRPIICFTIEQIQLHNALYLHCIDDFTNKETST